MLLDFTKEKKRRERESHHRRCLIMGEMAERLANTNPEFAAVLRGLIRNSSLKKKDKALILESLREPPYLM
ncbi:MAG TPA: hypothetical protein VFB14_24085 [Bryobacteraceae bacterium]|jgi:hypothetical protein|nr:hypothetical protein [Bryobacteraceae bacterium]